MGLPSVLIVDEDAQARATLRGLLNGLGHPVAGEAGNAQALILARGLRPGVVLVTAQSGTEEITGTESVPDTVSDTGIAWKTARTMAEARIAAVVAVAPASNSLLAATAYESGAQGFLSYPLRAADVSAVVRIADARFREQLALEGEVRGLNAQIEARRLLGRAKAILMERHQLTEREAFHRIQNQSAALNRPAHEIARAIITAHDMGESPTTSGKKEDYAGRGASRPARNAPPVRDNS